MKKDEDVSESYKIYKSVVATEYDVYLSKEIESDLNTYFDLLHLLDKEVESSDTVHIRLANYGGDLHAGIALANSIKSCKAVVVTHVISNCYSMAAILALCGDGIIIYPGNYLMFHNYSGVEVGKAGEIETSQVANKKSWGRYLQYFCKPFLTDEEVSSILMDRDLYIHFDSKGLPARCKKHFPGMVVKSEKRRNGK